MNVGNLFVIFYLVKRDFSSFITAARNAMKCILTGNAFCINFLLFFLAAIQFDGHDEY